MVSHYYQSKSQLNSDLADIWKYKLLVDLYGAVPLRNKALNTTISRHWSGALANKTCYY